MWFILSQLAFGAPGADVPVGDAPPSAALVQLSGSYTRASDATSEDIRSALSRRSWREAQALLEAVDDERLGTVATGELAFLKAWVLIRNGKADSAIDLLPEFSDLPSVPAAYRALTQGELLLANEQSVDALAALEKVPVESPIYPRAAVLRAKTLQKLNRTSDANQVYESIASRPDPADGNPFALLALAQHKGPGSESAYPYLRRLWSWYPASAEGKRAATLLGRYSGASHQPTAEEWSIRAEQWMRARQYDNAILAADSTLAMGRNTDEATCRALYSKGRSLYKKNQLTNSVAGFEDAGDRCVDVGVPYGAKALYLVGTAEFRRKRYTSSAEAFLKIPARYPTHSMADDGYMHAGISLHENEQIEAAQQAWTHALEDFPAGDTSAESTWRLAWSLYLSGNTTEAIGIARRLGELSPAVDAVHTDAGRYWAARWTVYPDVENPSQENPVGREEAIVGFEQLLRDRPFSFYAILAASRLAELAPDVLEGLQTRGKRGPLTRPWEVRSSVLEEPAIQNTVGLMRLGLAQEGLAEWYSTETEMTPDETAWLYQLRATAGDWLLGHEAFRKWIRSHPVGSLGTGERAVVRVAYPDRYWEEVKKASAPYERYEPRMFHSLVREESNFNRRIVSFAGARGLSQLMPATARQTAGWLGRSVTMDQLFDPLTNLEIGGRYLEAVLKQLDGSPYCALAGYNAGPARVQQWNKAWGNVPTDEFVERIPFRETRGYVKRVMGTWQTYRWYIDDGAPFADLSKYNHEMLPER